MGAAFVAIADDPSTIAHNPAGLAGLVKTNIYGGITALSGSTTYSHPSGADEETIRQIFLSPHFYIASDLNTARMAVGLGVFSPFGIGGRKWSEQGLTRYGATESLTATICANPALAWKITPDVSVGLGVYFLEEQSTSEKMMDQSTIGAIDGKMSLKGMGGGWGYNMGVLLFPGKTLSVGIAYRSGVRVKESATLRIENIAPPLQPFFYGSSTFETDVDTIVHFPPVANLGAAWRPSKSITLSFDAEWMGWSSFDRVDLSLRNPVPQAGLTSSSMPLNWRDTWILKTGAEYRVNDRIALRAGYVYVQNPVPDDTLNPGNPDSDQHNVAVGLGYTTGRLTLDAFYVFDLFRKRQVQNTILSGEYKGFAHVAGVSVGYRF